MANELLSSEIRRGGGGEVLMVRHLTLNLAEGFTCKLTLVESLELLFTEFSWICYY